MGNDLVVRNRSVLQVPNRFGRRMFVRPPASLGSQLLRHDLQSGSLDEILGVLAVEEEEIYFASQTLVSRARTVQKHSPSGLVVFQCGVIQRLDLPQALSH